MAETSRITLTDIWKQWEEMTSTLPKEAKEMADAYIRQKRADLPVSPDMHFEDLGPVDWLETMILDGNSGLDLLLNRMLYAAWRMGEGFLLGSGWSSIWRRALNESEKVSLCRKIGYSVEEVMEDTAWTGPEQNRRTCSFVFGAVAKALYIQYPYEQLTAYLDHRFGRTGFTGSGEENRWRLWMDGELLCVFLSAHDPGAVNYMAAFLSCLKPFPVLDMEDLPLRLALMDPAAKDFLLTRPLPELEQMGKYSGLPRKKDYDDLVDDILQIRQKEALEEIRRFTDARELTAWLKILYERAAFTDFSPLPALLGHRAKSVRTLAEKILYRHLDAAYPVLQDTLPKLQGEALQLAEQLLVQWKETHSGGASQELFQSREELEFYCEKNLLPAARKKAAWAPREWFGQVRYAGSSQKAPETVLEYLFVRYLSLTEPERLKTADRIAAFLNRQDLQAVLLKSWEFWLLEDCEPKHRLLILLCGIYGSDSLILQMEKGAEMLARKKRGEMAESIIRAIGKNGSPISLMILERQACQKGHRKPRMSFARTEQAARECFQKEADRLGISWDALADRIVSNAGFNQKGEQELNVGKRTLTVRLMPDLSLQVKDGKGAWRKSFPKPGKGEDLEPFETARLQFMDWKNQVKTIYEAQFKRLERVMRTGRCWQKEEWERLFLKNPILQPMAHRLIWGLYKNEQLTDAFCCLEDGSLCTAKDNAFLLPENACISLVCPVELSYEHREAWRQWMEDYEILPLPGQLEAPLTLSPEQIAPDGKQLLLWTGKQSSTGRLQALQTRYGAIPKDNGYLLMEEGIGGLLICAEEIPWNYHGPVCLKEAVFLNAAEEPCPPDALPARFVSGMLRLLDECLCK